MVGWSSTPSILEKLSLPAERIYWTQLPRWTANAGDHTIVPIHTWAHTIVPRHDCAQTRLCPDTIVPRHDCAQTRLFPDTIVPRHDCAQTRLCPDTFAPRYDCAHTCLYPDTFVPWHVIIVWSQSCLGRNVYVCAQIHIWYPERLTCYNKITKYSRRNTAGDCWALVK